MQAMPWMDFAWAELAVRERPGVETNPRITRYFKDSGHAEITDDETAWCAAFVGAMLERAKIASTRSLMARSYLSWGEAIPDPVPGAIAVLSRGGDPSLGHVGFVVAATGDRIILLGGNQSNAVSVEAYDRDRVVGVRLPKHAAVSAGAASPDADAVFATSLAFVLEHEGGWSDDPFDPGGATNKGITLAVYAREIGREVSAQSMGDLKAALRHIPDELVRRIYLERYWRPGRCPTLPPAIALFHFDACVNQGVGTAARFLQRALGVEADGEIGPVTLAAAADADATAVLKAYADIRRRHYRSLGHFWRFGRGWLARTDASLAAALRLVDTKPAAPIRSRPKPKAKETVAMPSDMTATELPTSPEPRKGELPPDAESPPTKWWGQSMTIWGALLTAVSTVAPAILATLGIDLPADLLRKLGTDVVTAIQAIAGLVGTVMTIAGRIRARTALEMRQMSIRM